MQQTNKQITSYTFELGKVESRFFNDITEVEVKKCPGSLHQFFNYN